MTIGRAAAPWRRVRGIGLGLTAVTALLGSCGDGGTEPGVEAFCARIAPLAALDDTLASGQTDLAALADEVADLTSVAPAEVGESLSQIATALSAMAAAAEASGAQGAEAIATGFAAIREGRTALDAASDTVANYAATECAVSLGGSRTE